MMKIYKENVDSPIVNGATNAIEKKATSYM